MRSAVALASSLRRERLARCLRIQSFRSAARGAFNSRRTVLRRFALYPLIARSISNRLSIRRTAPAPVMRDLEKHEVGQRFLNGARGGRLTIDRVLLFLVEGRSAPVFSSR